MNLLILRIAILFITMIALIAISLTTSDAINSELFASLAIIIGAYSYYQLSNIK